MRLWSLHPSYLDTKGLVALWREGLLAKKVLQGATRGYINHPQLIRFRRSPDPLGSICCYLQSVYEEAFERGYNFSSNKLDQASYTEQLTVTEGQLIYELQHLKSKLKSRDPGRLEKLIVCESPRPHPLFKAVQGGIEEWEVHHKP